MSIYVHEFQMAQAKAKDVLSSGMEEARKQLSENNDRQSEASAGPDAQVPKTKASVRLVKVTERKHKRK